MLSLRLVIFTAVFGIALSGLFWLLGNLSEPELLRSRKAVVVKGCDPIEGEEAVRLCPRLFCQKFLLDTRAFELRYRFDVTVDKRSGAEHLIGGVARPFVARPGDGPARSFACVLEGTQVIAGWALEDEELTALAEQDSWQALIADAADTDAAGP